MSIDRRHHANDENKKPKQKMNIYEIGTKVTGEYYGEKYSGIVDYGRPHTMNDSYIHFVKLDVPITVFGAERQAVVITSGKENTITA